MATASVIEFPSLYEITDHVSALFDSLDGADTPEMRAQVESDLMQWLESESRKVDNIAGYLAHCEAQAEFAAAEAQRLRERGAVYLNRAERLKDYVMRVMTASGKKRLEGRTATLSLRQCPPSVEIADATAIPEEFVRRKVEITPDKRAIKTAVEAGQTVPGAELRPGRWTLRRS